MGGSPNVDPSLVVRVIDTTTFRNLLLAESLPTAPQHELVEKVLRRHHPVVVPDGPVDKAHGDSFPRGVPDPGDVGLPSTGVVLGSTHES